MDIRESVEKILPYVQKPSRYIGMEINSTVKDPKNTGLKMLLSFPDTYEIGMSHFGLKILYEIINNRSEYCAERTFAPWPDMEQKMREQGIPLFSLENHLPARSFDLVGFSLQYELSYTNVLNMLDLAGIPLYRKDREKGKWPIIIAGGPCVYNPEPIADFFDLIMIGEAEETLMQVMDSVYAKKEKADRREIIATAAEINGVYAPQFYNNRGEKIKNDSNDAIPAVVEKSFVRDLNDFSSPLKQLVPLTSIVHDRATIEIMRGCPKSCRFCQAGIIYRPWRIRKKDRLIEEAMQIIKNTGYQELSLSSLSTGDYPHIAELIDELTTIFKKRKISISVPSLRVDSFSVNIAKKISEIKKTGFTFACEAGSERMLNIIKKQINIAELYDAASEAYKSGWNRIKLYFMIGLPGETNEDIDKIADIVTNVSEIKRKIDGRPGNVNVTVSSFVPKANTPFQWVKMNTIDQLKEKQRYLKKQIRNPRISLKFHEIDKNIIEGVFSRGDRDLSKVIVEAWRNGAKFDDWREHFNNDIWTKAFEICGIAQGDYLDEIDTKRSLPWEHINAGVSKETLLSEYRASLSIINKTD